MTTSTVPVGTISREVLEDRYEGLRHDDQAMEALDEALWTFIVGVSRRPRSVDDQQDHLIDDLHELIQAKVIDTIHASGLAR